MSAVSRSRLNALIAKLPESAIVPLVGLVTDALNCQKPDEYIVRKLAAESAHKATQDKARQILSKSRKGS